MTGTDRSDLPNHFTKNFATMIVETLGKDLSIDDKRLLVTLNEQGRPLVEHVFEAVESYFGDCEVFSVEEKLFEPITKNGMKFKGYIDLVLKKGDKYHIIDWKTSTWGWKARKKSDKLTTYQLTLYKHYFAKKHKIDPKNIETHFGLLKRTAKKNPIEIFRVTSGEKKTQNALKLLNDSLYNMESGVCIRNKLKCQYCEYKHTEWC
jgi:predicted RecB family nuclease